MQVNPYLNFNGTAEEAFNFYKSVFGGVFTSVMRYKDAPQSENHTSEAENNRIMHISLPLGEHAVLMGSDISEEMGMKIVEGNNNYICLTPESVEKGREIFDKLSAGGKVEMKYDKMFWGDYFGSCVDKYGIGWMVDVADKESK